ESDPAAELPRAPVLHALGVDRASVELARDLMRQDDPAGRRPGDRGDAQGPGPVGDRRREALRLAGVLQHVELLEIPRRMPPRRGTEVGLAQRARIAQACLALR